MYPVTDAYKAAVYAPSRMVKARVTLEVSDITAKPDATVTTTAEASISAKAQLINGVRAQALKLATCERERFKLDGSFCFADDVLANNGEIGFVSTAISEEEGYLSPLMMDDGGEFISFPTLTFTFSADHSSIGATITFDAIGNEYATEFNISTYNASDVLIDSVDVLNNDDVRYILEQALNNYRKLVITIKKWCLPSRRARIAEVDFGVVKTYEDENLIRCSLVEELDLTSSQLPSAEFKFAVDNSDRAFNILNPDGFYAYLMQRQPVRVEMGVDLSGWVEYVPIGDYLLWEWASDEGALTASFTARTNLDLMANYDYENLVAETGYSIYDMAVDVFAACGITNYSIDVALDSISTNGLVQKTSARNVLQMIALAGCANIYVSRDNVITIACSPGSLGAAEDTVSMEDMYEEAKVALSAIVRSVSVAYWTNLSTSALVTVANPGVTAGEVLKLENNTLINTSARADAVADWLLVQRGYRNVYTMNWRGNPAHELADVIAIGNSYGADKKAQLTKTSLDYQGYLTAQTEARG